MIQLSLFYAHFVAHVPKSPFVGVPRTCWLLADSRLDALVTQALSFVTCLSFLGYKEWGFVIYVAPLLNVARSVSVPKGRPLRIRLYPGGVSLVRFNDRHKSLDNGTSSCSFIDTIRSASSSTRAHIQPGDVDRCPPSRCEYRHAQQPQSATGGGHDSQESTFEVSRTASMYISRFLSKRWAANRRGAWLVSPLSTLPLPVPSRAHTIMMN